MPLSDGSIAYFPFAIVDARGVIARMGRAEFDLIPLQAVDPGEVVISPLAEPLSGVVVAEIGESVSEGSHYWTGSAWAEYPTRPTGEVYWDGAAWQVKPEPWLEWDGTTWVDPRDPAQIAAELYQARYHTYTDKNLVFLRLAQEGAYPISELSDDTTYFPARVEEYLNTLPTVEHDEVKGALKYEPNIWRLHPYLVGDPANGVVGAIPWLVTEYSITITDDQLDEIFEVPVPPPFYSP